MRNFLLFSFSIVVFVSSTAFGQKPSPSPTPKERELTRLGEMRLTRIDSLTDALANKHYFYLKEEGFRIQLPGNFGNYVPSKPPTAGNQGTEGQITWSLPEAQIVIMFADVDAQKFAAFSAEQRLQILSKSLTQMLEKDDTKIFDRDLTVNGSPAKELRFDKVGKDQYLVRDLFVGTRLFVFVVSLNHVDKAEELAKQALDTFESIERPVATPPHGLSSSESVENGIFRSAGGRFSIAIPELPKQTIDKGTDKAKAKGIDAGKQFVWLIGRTLYTIYYGPPVDSDGNPRQQVYADIENGTRKGVANGGATLLSEKPVTLGKYHGTEFRYVLPNGVRYVNRIYLIGDMGYQVVGGYADQKDENAVLAVLETFKPLITEH